MTNKWTENEIPDLTGKVIVITGGNSGLGFEAAKMFAGKGARVVIASRNLDKSEKAVFLIQSAVENSEVYAMTLDLANLESIKNFAVNFTDKFDRLDVLLNNAGVMFTPYMKTENGFEYQNGVNHLGHFALTGQLLPILKETKDSRIVNVSSLAHSLGKMDWDDYLFEKNYNAKKSYGRSKLSNLLFTYELDRIMRESNTEIKVLAAHPGVSNTNLVHYLSKNWWFFLVKPIMHIISQNARMGALPEVRASVDLHAKSGQYYGPRGFMETRGFPILVNSNKDSHKIEDARKLWEISEEFTGVKFDL